MDLSVADIATLVGGEIVGDGSRRISGAAGLAEAKSTDASFLRDAKNADVAKAFEATGAGVVFVPRDLPANGRTVVRVKNPTAAFARVLELIAKEKRPPRSGVHPQAVVAPGVKLGANVTIGPLCVIEDGAEIGDGTTLVAQVYVGLRTKIGKDCLIYPQVVLREEVTIGDRCIIHAGAILGSDGYGFFFAEGRHNKVPQIGTVVIEDDVEIGSCTAIDRATTGRTIVRKGTKIDNLAQIAHNVDIGEHSLIVAQVGIGGSTTLGKGVVLAGQAGVADHSRIGDGVQVAGQSGVVGHLEPGAVVWGTPAEPIKEKMRQIFLLRRLPELMKNLKLNKGEKEDHA